MTDVQLVLPVTQTDTREIRLYRIVLPFLPPSKNVYDGWPMHFKSSCKQKWVKRIIAECEAQDMPKGLPQIGLAAVLVFPSNHRRDLQNYASTLWNFVPDALVRYGLVVDDNAGRIKIGRDLGLRFSLDTDIARRPDKKQRSRTHLAITMRL